MALLEIQKAGSPVLKKISEPIKKIDGKLRSFLDDMAETMYQVDGIGLAAPQVGRSIRAVVIDVGDGKLLELLNPEIAAQEGVSLDSEGCLSVPGIFGEVERSTRVTVEYTTRYGKHRKLEAENLLARCIQHELDHLNGILFIDVAKSLRQETEES
ncbi:MAG: peptide deformylase [Schwartzia sp.]|nr:peptide deformylase [Schwartzia sp. (in: firmicutes)]